MAKFEINGKPDKRKHASVLADRQKAITARQTEICEQERENGSRFSDDASKEFDALQEEFDACTASLEALGAKKLSGGWAMPTVAGPGAGRALGLDDDAPAQIRQHSSTTGGRLYADLFCDAKITVPGYDDKSRWFADLYENNRERLASAGGQSYGVPSDGGFLVPEAFTADLLNGSLESEIVRPRANAVPMDLPIKNISVCDDSDHSGGEVFGGLAGQWVEEAGTIATDTIKLYRMMLTARKLVMQTAATNELLEDVPTFARDLEARMKQAIGWNIDRTYLISGTGAGQPRSVLNDPALITVTKETGQPANTIVWENISKMAARLHPGSFGKAVWVANQTCMPQLMSLSISIGTGGTFVPAITNVNGRYQMLGMEIVFTEKANTLGTAGDLMLVDFSKYYYGILRNGMRVQANPYVNHNTDETLLRVVMRLDGQGSWKQAFVPLKGDSLSWCVALQTRA